MNTTNEPHRSHSFITYLEYLLCASYFPKYSGVSREESHMVSSLKELSLWDETARSEKSRGAEDDHYMKKTYLG